MRTAFSNIAWDPAQDGPVAEALLAAGISHVEIAPTKVWPEPLRATEEQAAHYAAQWRARGLTVVSTQSLLFGRPDLVLFGDDEQREGLVAYVAHILRLGGAMGATAQVFGSPRNRVLAPLTRSQGEPLAVDVFRRLGDVAQECGTTLCLEANPVEYGADYITTAAEAARLVELVDSAGFRLHLDTACMLLAGDDIPGSVATFQGLLQHVHLSEPQLGPVGAPSPAHEAMVASLADHGYTGFVSVEMRPTASSHVRAVAAAASYAALLVADAQTAA